MVSLDDRARACVVLGAVGDAMGYRGGDWEFALSTGKILKDLCEYTSGKGVMALDIRKWMVSDDTVEHLHSAEGLVAGLRAAPAPAAGDADPPPDTDPECPLGVGETLSPAEVKRIDTIMTFVAREFRKSAEDFCGRAPGKGEQQGLKLLKVDGSNWDAKPFDSRSGGCGAAMRTACFGLLRGRHARLMLPLTLESSRMTKTCPTGYLGGFTTAYFTYLAMHDVPAIEWGGLLLAKGIPACAEYLLESKGPRVRHVKDNAKANIAGGWFAQKWQWYLKKRGLAPGCTEETVAACFPKNYGGVDNYGTRDAFYAEVAKGEHNKSGKNPGCCGLSAVLIAYDALVYAVCASGHAVGSRECYETLLYHAVIHRGDNDSTASIALAWYGACVGLGGVPAAHHDGVQYRARANDAGRLVHSLTAGRRKSSAPQT